MSKAVEVALGSVAFLIVALNSAFAALYDYNYQGNPFDTFVAGAEQSQFTSQNAVDFSFITSVPIAANSTFQLTNIVAGNSVTVPSVLAWAITDGSFSYGAATLGSSLNGASVTTNSAGQIVSWMFTAQLTGQPESVISSCGTTPCLGSIGHTGLYAGDFDSQFPLTGLFLYAGLADTPGSWTSSAPISATPLPATLPLYATGLGALALLRWRRKRKAAANLTTT
jgi:hypothetical protein